MVELREIYRIITERFPERVAEDWDNVGLQLGRKSAQIDRVLVALELTSDIVREAKEAHAQLILTHHPFIFKPIKCVTDDSPEGRMLLELAENHIALMSMHTNLDAAPQAISEKLARDLDLKDCRVFLPHQPYMACKIIVFVPETHVNAVARAMHDAGAGNVGDYSSVSFMGRGQGRFTCGASSHPAIGAPGSAETVEEIRLEMVVSGRELGRVIEAMIAAHPYEEPAYDVFKLESDVHGMTDLYGFGVAGHLEKPQTLGALLAHLKEIWAIPAIRYAGHLEKIVQNVAILNGSGARFLSKCRNIDVYITGDCGHHDFDNARRLGIALVDAGHYDTEKFIPAILAKVLKESAIGDKIEVLEATTMSNPMQIL